LLTVEFVDLKFKDAILIYFVKYILFDGVEERLFQAIFNQHNNV